MNVKLHLEDKVWQNFVDKLNSGFGTAATLLKKAFLIIWPRESAGHFEAESGPEGGWPALSPVYAAMRARREGGGFKMLQISGFLRKSTTLNPKLVEFPQGLEAISDVPYSGYLDEGTSRMPSRPFMWLGDNAQQNIMNTIMEAILNNAGGTD